MGAREPQDGPLAAAEAGIFGADPEVGRDLAKVDWAATPLGPPAGWPQSLQTAVDILLSSRFSMWMGWGPDLTFFCNAAYRRDTLGRKYPWALGRPASEVWAEIWKDLVPRVDRVLSIGHATWDTALLLLLERSGYLEETYHTFSYSPLRDNDGRVVGMLCVVREDTEKVIGERRMATLRDLGSDSTVSRTEEQALAFSARQLGQNLRDLPFTLTYLLDESGNARLAAASGIAADHPAAPAVLSIDQPGIWPLADPVRADAVLVDLLGEAFSDLPTGEWAEPPTHALIIPLLAQGGPPYGFLVAALNRYRILDDDYRAFAQLVAGYVAAGIGTARSYLAQQRRVEELAELDRAKTTFFSNISHEFRTPLTLMQGPVAELLSRPSGIDERARQELQTVHRNGLRLAKLVNTLLDFSRIEAGRMTACYEPVDIAAVTGGLASVFRSAVERAGLVYDVDCPPLDEPVYLDRDMWEKVVLNLLSNALKFTFDGSITVRVTRSEGGAVVTVADTGIGVPAAEMPRLFERFHRIEAIRARSYEGSGIGLALVKELVGLHGGSITAESTEGAGTTFTIRLPFGAAHLPAEALATGGTILVNPGIADRYVQEALQWLPDDSGAGLTRAVASAQPADTGHPSAALPARVLVADDNADMRQYLARILGAAGYEVFAVSDGQQALEAVRADGHDLVISDVMMPRLDGLGLIAALRTDSRTAAVPVLLLSARAGQEAAIEGLEAGADDYLVKPFAAAELLARVRANIELARLRSHHARWRTALVDSLQEAFFVCDEHGTVIEINAAFADILGYGQDGLPYEAEHPWWPDADAEPEAHHQVEAAFAGLLGATHGSSTVPVTHRDGHRLWVTFNFNHADDPESGRRVMVGTLRDVTAEHYHVQRQTALAELHQQLAQADTVDDALRAAADALRRLWGARRILAATFSTDHMTAGSASGAPELLSAGEPGQWGELPPRTRELINSLRDGDLLTAYAQELGTAGIALQHPQGVLVLFIELAEQRLFTPEDQTLLTVLAGRLGQGLQRVHRLDQQRETALALQHAILGPAQLPAGFAVRYQPATRPLQVGGDWYDVVALDDGRIALIVGDCVGHGLTAATVMGQLRSACRALLFENHSPGAALAGLDRFAARLPGARCTTAFCAVLDPETGELIYSRAGHPPPILVHADRTTQMLEDGRTLPLGVRPDWPRSEARITMPPRATLLLYTDGLVERRRHPLDQGIARAADLVQNGRDSALDDLASQIMFRLAPTDGYQDDVALMLYRQPAPLEMNIPADAGHLATARDALRTWLTRAGVDPDQNLNVLIAAGEAVTNAIEHGHRNSPDGSTGVVNLRATTLVDCLQLTVTDNGSWKTPDGSSRNYRGRGITLMRALMQDVTIDPDDAGTTVHLQARIN